MSIVDETIDFGKMIIGVPKPETIMFHKGTELVGTLYLDETPMRFDGDVDESSQVFWDNLRITGSSLKKRIAELEDENAKLSKDKTRLEWLVTNLRGLIFWGRQGTSATQKHSLDLRGGNWRDAIDEAMKDE